MTDLLNPFLTKGLTSSAFKSEVLGQLPPTKIAPNPKTNCNPNPKLNSNRVGERGGSLPRGQLSRYPFYRLSIIENIK